MSDSRLKNLVADIHGRVTIIESDPPGSGVPDGGTTGQVLTKASDNDGDAEWSTVAGTGTVITSGTPVANDFARFTDATTIEGRSYAETRTDLGLVVGTNVQAYSANLDEYAAVNPTAAGLALLDDADASAQRTTLGLVIGTNVQAYSANLDEYAAVNPTAAGLALLDDIDASAQRTTLGLDTTANQTDSSNKRFMTDAQESKLDAISGTNTGDQTSIVGITGTKAQFDTAVSDGNFLYVGDVTVPTAASTTEALTGTDSSKFVTADALAALWEQGSNIASAGTISIGEGGFFHITGTTTITDIDFGTDKTGRRVWLVFDGVLTLTHNATSLILPTGANITTAAGDTALVVSEGSDNVRVVAYYRKDGTPLTGGGGTVDISGTPTTGQTAVWTDANTLEGVTPVDLSAVATKNTPVDADTALIFDSAASNAPKRLTWANLKLAVRTYLDAVTVLTDGANIATDCSLGKRFRVTLGGNRTLDNPTNPSDGVQYVWEFIQDATGSRTITLGSKFAFGTDITGLTLTTTASKRDFVTAIYNTAADKFYIVGVSKGY